MVTGAAIRQGLMWTVISRGGTQILQVVFSVALARLVAPHEFGIIAMLLTFGGFAQLLTDSGVSSSLIYKEGLSDEDISTGFWIQVIVGLLVGLIFVACARPIANFFQEPALQALTLAMALVFIAQSIGQTHATLIRRELRFRLLSLIGIASVMLSGLTAVILAFLGFGVWALYWQILLQAAVTSILSIIYRPWLPSLAFDRRTAASMSHYGGYLLAYSSLNYWLRNGDNLLIGRVLGAGPLGIYARAYNLMLLPLSNISSTFGQVMFPALTRIQSDPERFRRVYLRAIRMIGFAAFPLMAGLSILSKQAILIMYGPHWAAVIPIFSILSVVGIIQAIGFPMGWVFTAMGHTQRLFYVSVFLAFAFALAMWIGLQRGLIGITLAYACWTMLSLVSNMYAIGRISGIYLSDLGRQLWKIAIATLAMSAAAWWLNQWIVDRTPLIVSALAVSVTGIIIYTGANIVLREEAFVETLALVRAKLVPLKRNRKRDGAINPH